MPYSPPAYNAADIAFAADGSYTVPAHGAANVELASGPQTVALSGFIATAYGTASVVNSTREIAPSGFLASLFGTTHVTLNVPPADINFALEGPYTVPAYNAANIDLAGTILLHPASLGSLLAFGTTVLTGGAATVLPSGFATLVFGTAQVSGQNTIAPGSLGDGAVVYVPSGVGAPVGPTGFTDEAFGTAAFTFGPILPVGFSQLKFGFPLDGSGTIDFLNRTLHPSGVAPGLFGTAELSGGVREVDQAGNGVVPPGFGTQFVAYKERRVNPLGIGAGEVPRTHTIGTTQFVTPSGWVSLAFGATVVHDNRQFAAPAGLVETAYGLPQVYPNPRAIVPLGIHDDDTYPHGAWGLAQAYNQTQIVAQLFDDRNTDYLEGFGSPIHTLVENVNREVHAVGNRMDRVSLLANVSNAAVPIAPAGFGGELFGFGLGLHPDGTGFISYANRTFTVPGPYDAIGPEFISPFHQVSRTPEIDAPSLGTRLAFGLPGIVNTRRSFAAPSMGETQAWGVPRVEYLIRELLPVGLDAYGFAIPDVENGTRYIAASSVPLPTFAFGRASVEEHFTIVGTHGQAWGAMNDAHRIANVTPEVHAYWTDATLWGGNAIHNQWNFLYPQSWRDMVWGRTAIGERTQRPQAHGFNTELVSPFTDIHNDTPDPPPTRLILAQPASNIVGDGSTVPSGTRFTHLNDVFGSTLVQWNSIFPTGEVMTRFGGATVRANSLYPTSFWEDLQPGGQFGTPSLNSTQYVDVAGISGAFGDDADRIVARIDPFTIYCSFTFPTRYMEGLPVAGFWHYMDDSGADDGTRPFWGQSSISNQRREIVQQHIDGDEHDASTGERFGALTHIDLSNRVVRVDGIKGFRAGFPVVTHGGVADLDSFHYGIAPGDFGDASVALDVGTQRINPDGIAPVGFGANRCELLNRAVAPAGWDSAAYGTLPWPFVGPPNWRYLQGFIATVWGDQFISYRNREVVTVGALDESFTPDVDEFAQRMRIGRQSRIGPASIVQGAIGMAEVTRNPRSISGAGLMDTAIIARPDVRRLNIIALGGYGWLDEDFGDVWRVEDGTIKCRGWLAESLGYNGKLARTLPANGWIDEAFGSNAFGDVLYAAGFAGTSFGANVVTHVDGLEFTCGLLARALVAQGISSTLSFGTASLAVSLNRTVVPTGWLDSALGHPQVHGEDDIVTTGWLDEAFGTPQLNMNLVGLGFDDTVFGTAKSVMNIVASGIASAEAFGATRPSFGIGPSGFSTESWWADYNSSLDYAASDYFANDNATKVSHV